MRSNRPPFNGYSWAWGVFVGTCFGTPLGIALTCAILLPGDTSFPDFWNAVCR